MKEKDTAKVTLKELLLECTHAQQTMFKKMFCHEHLDYNIDQAINQMNSNSIDMAINQCKRTIKANKEKR
jgi:hypothetical protein